MFLDVLILCLPYPIAWRLQTTARQKFILTGMFLLGGFVVVFSILRITSFNFPNLEDQSYVATDSSTWSSIEQSVGIICACLPTLRPLFRAWCGSSKMDSTASNFPKRLPLSGRLSQRDEEGGVVSPVSPVPLACLRGHSSHEMGLLEHQDRDSLTPMPPMSPTSPLSRMFERSEHERLMPRPESFA
ncbi:uncharacterized protein N7498_006970 [Penicillium cinerascens]|uniref:Rhodopsin domain-containing protein n=1 Tax=Penicillium cinerascens TaxID=70096 RepID=A0A9W9JJ52_9EURO|nr:uncharacterized protein N7498_006970 [Penicillium cinerascens]KAJ5197853.1 hypothetical protein N7498_006970 [Penicillium cinerascens]